MATLRIQGKPGLCENLLKERERGERKSKSGKEGGGRKKKGKNKRKGGEKMKRELRNQKKKKGKISQSDLINRLCLFNIT